MNVSADGTRIVITAQEIRERGAGYTMSDLLGATSGIYGSAAEVDAEIADGRAELSADRPTLKRRTYLDANLCIYAFEGIETRGGKEEAARRVGRQPGL